MNAAILEMCGAVLRCDAASPATKERARVLAARCGWLGDIFGGFR